MRNITKGLADRVVFVDNLIDCDILFIASPMAVDKEEVFLAKRSGKKIVLRVDNIPRKSRNKRSTPHERMKDYATLADIVIYQSEWARDYCYPLCGMGTVIYNGVDGSIFYPPKELLSYAPNLIDVLLFYLVLLILYLKIPQKVFLCF